MIAAGLTLVTAVVVAWLIACDDDARAQAARLAARLRGRLRLRRVPALRVDGCGLSEYERDALDALEAAETARERRPA